MKKKLPQSRTRRPSPTTRRAAAARGPALLARVDRLESIEAIRMLAAQYALSLDMRDVDAHVNLFAPDIRVGRERVGRAHLKVWVDAMLREQFTGTSHHLGGHIIEFTDSEHAHGVVYSKNEHETAHEWVIMQMLYWDDYERIGGRWYFRRRLPCYWYASDLNKPPLGDLKMRWPGRAPYEGTWHDLWPSWRQFWASPSAGAAQVAAPAPLGQFLRQLRRGAPDPKIRVR
jgi:SnoaL-like domain